jgi:hypothetical protein
MDGDKTIRIELPKKYRLDNSAAKKMGKIDGVVEVKAEEEFRACL